MTNEEKILFADYILRFFKKEEQEMPKQIGVLNRAQGFNWYKKCDVGHPVYEYKDRYYIYVESNDGKMTMPVPYYKETLRPLIDFA